MDHCRVSRLEANLDSCILSCSHWDTFSCRMEFFGAQWSPYIMTALCSNAKGSTVPANKEQVSSKQSSLITNQKRYKDFQQDLSVMTIQDPLV